LTDPGPDDLYLQTNVYDSTVQSLVEGIIQFGMGFPKGTSKQAAFDFYTPESSAIVSNGTVSVTVNALFPLADCEITNDPPENSTISQFTVQSANGSMIKTIYLSSWTAMDIVICSIDLNSSTTPECLTHQQIAPQQSYAKSTDNRTVFQVFDIEYDSLNRTAVILSSQTLVCRLYYSLESAILSYQMSPTITGINLTGPITTDNQTWPDVDKGVLEYYIQGYFNDFGALSSTLANVTLLEMAQDPNSSCMQQNP
jgi:hypothetical protein